MTARSIRGCYFLGALIATAAHGDDAALLLSRTQPPLYTWSASTDPKHQNNDYCLLQPGETRRIPLPPGRLLRLWSTAFAPTKIDLSVVNGQSVTLLSNGQAKLGEFYKQAYVLYPTDTDPAGVRVLGKGAQLVAHNAGQDANKFFYQVAVGPGLSTVSATPIVAGKPAKPTSVELPSGKETTLFDNHGDNAVMSQLAITLDPATLETMHAVRLRAWWDKDQPDGPRRPPAIDAPLASLAGQFWSLHPVDTALWSFDGKSLKFKVLLPLTADARITATNNGNSAVRARLEYSIADYGTDATKFPFPNRFCAVGGSTQPTKGKPIAVANINGSGLFCGFILAIEPGPKSNRRKFAFLEGNETITADGVAHEGTGTEDFYNSAWYFPNQPFARPTHGLLERTEAPPRIAAYRLLLRDAVPFNSSLKFEQEHGNGNSADDMYFRWVAMWYQKPPLSYDVPDLLKTGTPSATANAENMGPGGSHTKTVTIILIAGIIFVFLAVVARRVQKSA